MLRGFPILLILIIPGIALGQRCDSGVSFSTDFERNVIGIDFMVGGYVQEDSGSFADLSELSLNQQNGEIQISGTGTIDTATVGGQTVGWIGRSLIFIPRSTVEGPVVVEAHAMVRSYAEGGAGAGFDVGVFLEFDADNRIFFSLFKRRGQGRTVQLGLDENDVKRHVQATLSFENGRYRQLRLEFDPESRLARGIVDGVVLAESTYEGRTGGFRVGLEANVRAVGDALDARFDDFGVSWDCAKIDCNRNGIDDEIDVENGTSLDEDGDGIPDECQGPDCNNNGLNDGIDIKNGTSVDRNENGIPDECEFFDHFNRDDGPPENWFAYAGTIEIRGQELVLEGPDEPWAWIDQITFQGDLTIQFEVTFDPPDLRPGVGRHGGVMFFATEATRRWKTSGYTIDWIDRDRDRGYRIHKWTNGGESSIFPDGMFRSRPDPGRIWRITVEGAAIRFEVDGEVLVEFRDADYREGLVGLWGYSNGQHIHVDNVVVVSGLLPTFRRGDANSDGEVDIADPITTLGVLFLGQGAIRCEDAADSNDDGGVDLSDAIFTLGYLFLGRVAVADPGPNVCGIDPTEDSLGCGSFENCP